jgi:hypothetical protein
LSCEKEDQAPVDLVEFFECNDALNLDTTGIANRLVGKWELKSWDCGECQTPGWHYDKNVVAYIHIRQNICYN